jgi:hypothetical protein
MTTTTTTTTTENRTTAVRLTAVTGRTRRVVVRLVRRMTRPFLTSFYYFLVTVGDLIFYSTFSSSAGTDPTMDRTRWVRATRRRPCSRTKKEEEEDRHFAARGKTGPTKSKVWSFFGEPPIHTYMEIDPALYRY